jgi:hypothetical protein
LGADRRHDSLPGPGGEGATPRGRVADAARRATGGGGSPPRYRHGSRRPRPDPEARSADVGGGPNRGGAPPGEFPPTCGPAPGAGQPRRRVGPGRGTGKWRSGRALPHGHHAGCGDGISRRSTDGTVPPPRWGLGGVPRTDGRDAAGNATSDHARIARGIALAARVSYNSLNGARPGCFTWNTTSNRPAA